VTKLDFYDSSDEDMNLSLLKQTHKSFLISETLDISCQPEAAR